MFISYWLPKPVDFALQITVNLIRGLCFFKTLYINPKILELNKKTLPKMLIRASLSLKEPPLTLI